MTVKGIVKAGKIEPTEHLDAADGTLVTILVPTPKQKRPHRMMTLGMFAKPDHPGLSEEDAREMKHIWEQEWERSWQRLEKK